MDENTWSNYILSIRTTLYPKHKQIKSKRLKKIFYAKNNQKIAGVTMVISDKINFKYKSLQESKRTLYISKRFKTEDIAIMNMRDYWIMKQNMA